MVNTRRGTKRYLLIYAELITAARYRGTVTYQQLADLVGLALQGAHMAAELGEYLGAIVEDEVQQGRPLLSALTIRVTGQPWSGCFALAKALGKLTNDNEALQQAFWEVEKQAVYETWQRSFPRPNKA
jgi:hypothetical protein